MKIIICEDMTIDTINYVACHKSKKDSIRLTKGLLSFQNAVLQHLNEIII